MESKSPVYNQPVHIINLDIQDNHEAATIGAFLICDMVHLVIILLILLNENIIKKTTTNIQCVTKQMF
jgi:hypothetical protein